MKCLFVTGTRADFGKMKGLISALSSDESLYSIQIVATGMHLLTEFGSTLVEIENTFPNKVVQIKGQKFQENMSNGFARFISGFNLHLESEKPDVVLVHGDRFDALGAAIAASNMGIHVVHIEGGEVSGTIDEAIGRDTKDRVKQAVSSNGKEAVTHYRVIDRYQNHTHIQAILETGRTHQIRVHLSHIGYPLIGDPMYGGKVRFPKKADEVLKEALVKFNRQALHARKLTLTHPTSGELMSWKAPLPEDMLALLDVLNDYDPC